MKKITDFKGKLIIIIPFALMYILLFIIDANCIIRAITGIYCPFCGMTRSVLALLRLDFIGATLYHPMVWTLPILLLYYLYDGRPIEDRRLNFALIIPVALGFAVVWILRLCGLLSFI